MSRPTTLPTWATDTNYPAGAKAWSGLPTKLEPTSGIKGQGIEPEVGFGAQQLNWELWNRAKWVEHFDAMLEAQYFGDGTDGAVTLGAGTTTLTRDMYYTTLVIPNGATLATKGFAVYATTSITQALGGTITGSGSQNTAGIAPAGPHSVGTQSINVNAPQSEGRTYSNLGGLGGNGGNGTAGTGGTTTSSSAIPSGARPYLLYPFRDSRHQHYVPQPTVTGWLVTYLGIDSLRGGVSGGGGTGNGAAANGGAAGQGGDLIVLIAPTISLAGAMTSNGGGGGAGDAGNTGGGGGGGGGAFLYVCRTLTNTATHTANAGAGGARGSGATTATNGTAGAAGVTTPYRVTVQ